MTYPNPSDRAVCREFSKRLPNLVHLGKFHPRRRHKIIFCPPRTSFRVSESRDVLGASGWNQDRKDEIEAYYPGPERVAPFLNARSRHHSGAWAVLGTQVT